MGAVKVKRVKLSIEFDVWDGEVEVEDVPGIVEYAVDHAGYSLHSTPEIVSVTDAEVEC